MHRSVHSLLQKKRWVLSFLQKVSIVWSFHVFERGTKTKGASAGTWPGGYCCSGGRGGDSGLHRKVPRHQKVKFARRETFKWADEQCVNGQTLQSLCQGFGSVTKGQVTSWKATAGTCTYNVPSLGMDTPPQVSLARFSLLRKTYI